MGDDEDFPEGMIELFPERFSKWVLVRAGLDFLGHVLQGAHCAVGIVAQGVIQAEVYESEKKNFQESIRADLEMLPETED